MYLPIFSYDRRILTRASRSCEEFLRTADLIQSTWASIVNRLPVRISAFPGRAAPQSRHTGEYHSREQNPMNEKQYASLIAFWRSVEALSPQKIPKLAPSDRNEPSRNWETSKEAPWTDTGFKRRFVPANKMWRHQVYTAVYQRMRFVQLLENCLGKPANVFEERLNGESCVFSISFGEDGRPRPESFILSMAAWAFGIVEARGLAAISAPDAYDASDLHTPTAPLGTLASNSGFPGFDLQNDRLREELAWRIGNLAEDETPDAAWFADFVRLVIEKCCLHNLVGADPLHRVKSVQVRRPKKDENDTAESKSEDDFLNSFFINDLNRLIEAGLCSAGMGMQRYLEPPPDLAKVDVRHNRVRALDLLSPANFPEGCWPAEHPLVWSQQVAINAMWKTLPGGRGTFAVNGPPGTGKTTLLRDVVAGIIVDRAKILADRGSAVFGNKMMLDVSGRKVPYYPLTSDVAGFSIVVASSNNGAVENVSLELPKADAIHDIWSGNVDVYRDLAGELIGESAWALVAGRLGNKGNRSEFSSKFWWKKSGEDSVAGLRERLDTIAQGKGMPAIAWMDAVRRFKDSLTVERHWRQELAGLQGLPARISKLANEKCEAENNYREAYEKPAVVEGQITDLATRITDADRRIGILGRRLQTHKDTRPGILEWIASFGKAHRRWRDDLQSAVTELEHMEDARVEMDRQRGDAQRLLASIQRRITELENAVTAIMDKLQREEAALAGAKAKLGKHWPDLSATEDQQEQSSPWAHPEWRAARIRVFLAAMDLHRAFIEENARKMMANLALAMDALAGGIPNGITRQIAFDSLAIACPVISTAFASVPSLFGEMGAESIGWLLIDEAGQATPQAAAGAIWRARRIMAVGDPLQLEPVVTLPRTIEAALAASYGNVGSRWHPSRTSVQILADQTTPIGTTVGAGDDAIWVGAPLRVHRRCDDPMFSVSNAIAYEGMMVHQKKAADVLWPASDWIHVPNDGRAGSNWVPAEGEALKQVLQDLTERHQVPRGDIFLVSPFADVVKELYGIGKSFQLNPKRVGTVHTTQGKEAHVVIMVLGGGTVRARDWVAEKPNLLNVAASRAKTRFYVVGDRQDWSGRRYFDVLSDMLKLKPVAGASAGTEKGMLVLPEPDGQSVDHVLLEKAIDFMIWLESDLNSETGAEDYQAALEKHAAQIEKAKSIMRRYGEQVAFEEMQKTFYRITNSRKYAGDPISCSAARTALTAAWDGVAGWQR